MSLCGVSHKLPYCIVITSIFLKIWYGRESHQDIKVCSKRQAASFVLFQDFQRGTIMYCNHLARIDSSINPRHLIQTIVPSEASWLLWKFAYLCLHCLKCSYFIPGKKTFSLSVKTHTRCLHILFYVRISHRGPSRNSQFVLLLLYIGFCQSLGTGVTGLDNVLLSRSSDLMELIYRYISNTTSNQ